MPIPRRVIRLGDSRAVTLPAGWLEYYEKKYGRPIEVVFMELNSEITLSVEPPPETMEEESAGS